MLYSPVPLAGWYPFWDCFLFGHELPMRDLPQIAWSSAKFGQLRGHYSKEKILRYRSESSQRNGEDSLTGRCRQQPESVWQCLSIHWSSVKSNFCSGLFPKSQSRPNVRWNSRKWPSATNYRRDRSSGDDGCRRGHASLGTVETNRPWHGAVDRSPTDRPRWSQSVASHEG
jgi:hypothetical protein